MSKKKDTLLQEAVADAKTLRETALANAKLALEETFTPHLTSMLSTKLKKEAETMEEPGEEYEEISEELDSSDIGGNGVTTSEPAPKEPSSSASDSSNIKNDKSLTEDDEPTLDDEESVDVDAAAPTDDIASNDDEEENDLDLEAIIRELEEEPAIDDEEELDFTSDAEGDAPEFPAAEVPAPDAAAPVADAGAEAVPSEIPSSEDEEEIDLEEILREMEAEDGAEEDESQQSAIASELEEVKGELKEYRQVVKLLRSRLQETNLLNAKLLYTNKLFKNYNMNVGQKMRVIETFDRAQNVREAKLVFATLAESFGSNGSKKKRVVENTASKVVVSTAPKSEVITEGATLATRFKKLAGIK